MGTTDRRAVFRVPRGATGFRHINEPELPQVDPAVCDAAWDAAARAAGGEVGYHRKRWYPQNFHCAALTDRAAAPHVALFHGHHPYVAFVPEPGLAYTDEFLDPPTWADALTAHGFTVLGAALLRTPVQECDTGALAETEWHQIDYWQPPTLGALLFNWWD
ncbi:hypothetical protein [Streptomyces sp. WAC06614]|uniref:hypothetical protein n=1 Tax=Streptomyces sp. WAC06614 TaxID=2487416 RepID=UPI000F770FEF|nr:hypothetical protein [Streptomyces sp. WAC06614]RSS81927.1 hypothetical protein EF918_08610 [Streptomyces sp. WAC06614]